MFQKNRTNYKCIRVVKLENQHEILVRISWSKPINMNFYQKNPLQYLN